ncbi:ROOT HAIR defective 3 GTP-binding family protein, partial [Trifolium medium]|nr:ROOT HAIR defective 3 GTP-binding family protein [Trifolium medium]
MGKQVIFVVVDRLSKYAHFMALSHPFTALDVAQLFLDNVFKLHGLPSTITSDRDPIFLSKLWNDLFQLQGVYLNKSTAYHPQTDGQTEIVNKCLETYLRCMCADKPSSWVKWLSLAEWWYNTNFHSSIQTTPFEVVYGQPPPLHLPYLPGESSSLQVDRTLSARETAIQLL